MIKVRSEITIYDRFLDIDHDQRKLVVESHESNQNMVNISIDDGLVVTVLAKDLEVAILNAINNNRL